MEFPVRSCRRPIGLSPGSTPLNNYRQTAASGARIGSSDPRIARSGRLITQVAQRSPHRWVEAEYEPGEARCPDERMPRVPRPKPFLAGHLVRK